MWEYYYEQGSGPVRNGQSKHKPAILPTERLSPYSYEGLCELATEVVNWGESQYHNDHGRFEDHQMLVDFVNAAMTQVRKGMQ
jgi:hypothetical protein